MVYVTGDVHGFFGRVERFCAARGTSVADVLVILGDASVNYWGGAADEALRRRLAALPCTLLCVHGNHDMRPASAGGFALRDWCGGRVWAHPGASNVLFAHDGSLFELDGLTCLVAGGAYTVDRAARQGDGRPLFADEQPGPAERTAVERACEHAGWRVDVVLSHTCPQESPPELPRAKMPLDTSTERWLASLERRLSFDRWMHGHFHVDDPDPARRVWPLHRCVVELGSGRVVYDEADDVRAFRALPPTPRRRALAARPGHEY